MSNRTDPTWATEQVRVSERRLAELQSQRAEVLLELADNPSDEDIHASLEAFDLNVKRVEDRIANLNASMTQVGRRDAAAFAKRRREEAEALTAKGIDVLCGARIEAAAAVDAAVASLVASIEEYEALGNEAAMLIGTGMRPLCDAVLWRRSHITVLAHASHGTLTALLQMLQSRDVRAMHMREHAQTSATRLEAAIARTKREAAAKAAT